MRVFLFMHYIQGEASGQGSLFPVALEELVPEDHLVLVIEALSLEPFVVGEADAKMMRTHVGPSVAYNVQTAVDSEHCLILHHEVTDAGTDNQQLVPMATAAKAVLEQESLDVTADADYSNGEHFQACEDATITAYVPPNRAVNTQGDGRTQNNRVADLSRLALSFKRKSSFHTACSTG
jgi:hypothetical protein